MKKALFTLALAGFPVMAEAQQMCLPIEGVGLHIHPTGISG